MEVVNESEVRTLPPSRECAAAGKSILKANAQENQIGTTNDGPIDEPQSLIEIMDSIVHQLARGDTAECVDAYQTLAAAVKAYDDLPDQSLLRSKLHLITKSMKQHLTSLDRPDFQPTETNLVTSALKVVVILVWNPDFSPYLTDDFRLFVLDRAITTIVEHRAPKSVVMHYLHFLATQEFRSNLLTQNRAAKIIDGLAGLSEHFKGNGIVSERLLVYTRLLDQVKGVMKSKAAIWTEQMLSAMMSTIQDTRGKALALGRKACQCFPPTVSIATTLKGLLDSTHDERHTKGSFICKKLEKLVLTRDHADSVPQMWAVILLLCTSSTGSIGSWSGLPNWLQLIQRCFNSSDSSLRIQANFAWNRFIYAVRPHDTTDEHIMSLLAKPVVAQLQRKSIEKGPKGTYNAAMSSYCTLLYYAMRPTVTPHRLSKLWNEYIVKVIRSSFLQNPANADMACRILISLFWNWKSGQKIWNENRAHENRHLEAEELPTLDCKWVRSKAAAITELFAALFQHCSWGRADSIDQAYVSKAWRSFLKSIRSASSKEIKLTGESRSAALAILNFVADLPLSTIKNIEPEEKSLSKTAFLNILRITITELQPSFVIEALESNTSVTTPAVFSAIGDELRQAVRMSYSLASPKPRVDLVARFLALVNGVLVSMHDVHKGSEPETCVDLMYSALTLLTPEFVEEGLAKFQTGLALFIQDEDRDLPASSLDRLAEPLTKALSKVQPRNVEAFDGIFAAAFASSHRTVVSSMATAWNDTFGVSIELQIGPMSTEALQRLRPYVELRMPPGCMDSWSEERSSVPYYETQVSANGPQSQVLDPVEEAKMEQKITEPAPPEQEEHRNEVATTSRRRHDDSQVVFVPVDSSPIQVEVDSQDLTERQRAVRERQRLGPAVTFADIRSSPRPSSRAHSEARDCGLARKAARLAERPSTPPLPEQADEAEVQPSPTPKSRSFRNLAEVEIPSSPPSVQGHQDRTDERAHVPITSATEVQDRQTPVPDDERDLISMARPDISISEQREADPADADIRDSPEIQHQVPSLGAAIEPAYEPQAEDDEPVIREDAEEVQTSGDPQMDDKHMADSNESQQLRGGSEGVRPDSEHADMILPERLPADDIDHHFRQSAPDTVIEQSEIIAPVIQGEIPLPQPLEGEVIGHSGLEEDLNNGAEIPSTPMRPRPSSGINSDELEYMSASQLSQDLDWSVVLEGLDSTPVTSTRKNKASSQTSVPASSSQNTQTRPTTRKRKAASASWSRTKKRKAQVQPQKETNTSQESFIKVEDEAVDDDMIEVLTSDPAIPSSPPQIDAEGDMFVDAPESQESVPRQTTRPVRKTGRKKSARLSQADRQSSVLSDRRSRRSTYDLGSSPTNAPTSSQHRLVASTPVTENDEEPIVQIPDEIEVQEEEHVGGIDQTPIVEPEAEVEVVVPEKQAVDVLASLQAALDAVKNAPAGSIDLRAVDEMCFQIRYQAQARGGM